MIHIRPAVSDDAPFIALLARVTFTETFSHYFSHKQDLFNYYEQTFSVSKIKASLEKENNRYWIAFRNELPVGYAKLKKHSPTTFIETGQVSQLQKIYVLKEFLDQKIGKLLMDEVMKSFTRSGNSHIWLSVLKLNERAVQFYYRNDFKKIGGHEFQIGREIFDFDVLACENRYIF